MKIDILLIVFIVLHIIIVMLFICQEKYGFLLLSYISRQLLFTLHLHLLQIAANIAQSQDKQKRAYARKMLKGAKKYHAKVGDRVLRRNMVKITRKGNPHCS